MKKIFLYPFWLRFWHMLNALLCIILILSAVSLRYSSTGSLIFSKNFSIYAHNISGVLLSLLYIYYLIYTIATKNYKQYLIGFKGISRKLLVQFQYYTIGIFAKKENPFVPTEKRKFNYLQRISYFLIMFIFMPMIVISGVMLLFPEKAPDRVFGIGGILPVAILHSFGGFILVCFSLLHIYLATTGKTVGELTKAILSGWYLAELEEEEIDLRHEAARHKINENKRLFPIIFYNPLTIAGTFISFISFGAIIFFIILALYSGHASPYIGIITFIILPAIVIIGIILIVVGAFIENRKRAALGTDYTKKLPIIDLNNKKHQITTIVTAVVTLVLIAFSVFGSFKAYEYTESDEFCGTMCHKIMLPEYTAYSKSPHSRVGCATCHIGSGADWFVKAKISGSYQVYAALMDIVPKPIPTPVENLRPASQTCEQCHRPEHFYAEKKYDFNFFASDEKNSPSKISLMLKVGGGSLETGNHTGIHWAMNISNDISYIHTDRERNEIPWIQVRNKKTGKITIYTDPSVKVPKELFNSDNMRKMDCIDCHNRPSHQYKNPNIEVNSFMADGNIDKSLPYIKTLAVQTLENYVTSRETSLNDIKSYVTNYYKLNYPEILIKKKDELEMSVKSINEIYLRSYFPDMNVSWKKFPNNLGHMYSKGCFRCHDGKHVSSDGRVLSQDCNICHSIISQETPFTNGKITGESLQFQHPGSADKVVRIKNCPVCHGVQRDLHLKMK
jgi:thiosulfate reductase cytochrome b subunit